MKTDGNNKHNKLVREIIKMMRENGFCAWRIETRAIKTAMGFYVSLSSPGVPDIIAIDKNGTFIAIEVKTGNAHLRNDQREFARKVEENNGIFILARSKDDVATRLGMNVATKSSKKRKKGE
jgi:RecB family endonuclease NucS